MNETHCESVLNSMRKVFEANATPSEATAKAAYWIPRAILEVACQLERLEATIRLAAVQARDK